MHILLLYVAVSASSSLCMQSSQCPSPVCPWHSHGEDSPVSGVDALGFEEVDAQATGIVVGGCHPLPVASRELVDEVGILGPSANTSFNLALLQIDEVLTDMQLCCRECEQSHLA